MINIKSTSIQHRKRLTISFPTTNLVSVEDLTPRQLADQDVMTLLQHQKCHAAVRSSATRVVTVGIASGRVEGRGGRRGGDRGRRVRGNGEGGRKWVIAVAGITGNACITQWFYRLHWNSCSHERHWFYYTYLIGYTKVSMGIDEKLDYRVMSMKTWFMGCSFPIL